MITAINDGDFSGLFSLNYLFENTIKTTDAFLINLCSDLSRNPLEIVESEAFADQIYLDSLFVDLHIVNIIPN